MVKQGNVITVEVEVDVCCELCNDITKVYIDCPVCGTKLAKTSLWYDPLEQLGNNFTCCNCNSKFKLLDWNYPDAVIEVVEVSEHD